MKRILLAHRNQADATAFLRSMGPFTHSSLKDICQILTPPDNVQWVHDWTYFYEADVVYLHRPASVFDKFIIDKCLTLNIPLWVDMDDDLENVTPDNPVFHVYNNPDVKDTIEYAIEHADVLTVGGIRHYERIWNDKVKGREDVILIANGVDDRLLHFKKPFTANRKVSWRGSESHRTDLLFFNETISRVMGERRNYDWAYFGFNPFWLSFNDLKYSWLKTVNLHDYYRELTERNASIHYVPLVDTEFNRVKSNLSWLDATLAGSACLCPDFEEFRHPGIFLYNAKIEKDFYREFDGLFNKGNDVLQKYHDTSWDWIRDNVLVSKLNKKRREILLNL